MLEGKNILVVSPQPWGRMFVSKHHYAVELCRRGNRVWFLEGPRTSGPSKAQVRTVEDVPGLRVVSPRTRLPEFLRFKARGIYASLVKFEIALLLRHLGIAFDVVWSFEPNLYPDLRAFGAPVRIFHPVDMVHGPAQLEPARSADLVLSVAENILEKFAGLGREHHFVNHGLGPDFVRAAQRGQAWAPHPGPTRVGYVGNLFIQQLDRCAFRRIVSENADVEFNIWGPREPRESSLGVHVEPGMDAFVRFLRESGNVKLRGVASPSGLAEAMHDMDAFLLCYDPVKDPAAGANSHKILEYLSTGRVVVANHVTTYATRDTLLRMAGPGGNTDLPRVFLETIRDLAHHNAQEAAAERVRFALDQSYERHIQRIDELLERTLDTRSVQKVRRP